MTPSSETGNSLHSDPGLLQVKDSLCMKNDLLGIVGQALRKAFDEVIDGPRTGRYKIAQLEKTEKTYIGTKVEIILRTELGLERGKKLDNLIAGHEVDTKFSIKNSWMIPQEAQNEICLIVTGDDQQGRCKMGLLRMTPEVLTKAKNRDGKRSISANGRSRITWLVNGPMPRNFMLDLPASTREEILSAPSGRQAIKTLFTQVTGKIIPRSAIEQVAQQKDALKRAREMKALLQPEGFLILCANYNEDKEKFHEHGFHEFTRTDWLSIPISQ